MGKWRSIRRKKPANYVHPVMLTFLLMGRPAGREGAASMQSGKCILDAEAPSSANPTGTYKVGASLQILKERGYLSRQQKRALDRCEKAVTGARAKAAAGGRNADQAERHVREKHEEKAGEQGMHEVRKEIYLRNLLL